MDNPHREPQVGFGHAGEGVSGTQAESGGGTTASHDGWLLTELSRAEERERRRIAAELHGSVSQSLAAMAMRLCLLEKKATDPQCRQTIAEVHELLQDTIETTRCIVYRLCPPALHLQGLGAGLQTLATTFARHHGLKITVAPSLREPPLSEELRVFLYNASRELLFNVVRHAEASTAVVSLDWQADRLAISVRDNGIGFQVPPEEVHQKPGFGLFNVRERLALLGGRLEVTSLPGHGATVRMTLPVTAVAAGGTAGVAAGTRPPEVQRVGAPP